MCLNINQGSREASSFLTLFMLWFHPSSSPPDENLLALETTKSRAARKRQRQVDSETEEKEPGFQFELAVSSLQCVQSLPRAAHPVSAYCTFRWASVREEVGVWVINAVTVGRGKVTGVDEVLVGLTLSRRWRGREVWQRRSGKWKETRLNFFLLKINAWLLLQHWNTLCYSEMVWLRCWTVYCNCECESLSRSAGGKLHQNQVSREPKGVERIRDGYDAQLPLRLWSWQPVWNMLQCTGEADCWTIIAADGFAV